jgi:hypothetical protein
MALCKYGYSATHNDARYVAEMILLAPGKVRDLFQIISISGPVIVGGGNYAQFHWFREGATNSVCNEKAIALAKSALADAVATFAATRTAMHVPSWTFMYNRACKEDLDVVAAIRASPPPVGIHFALNTNLPPGENCVLFPNGGHYEQARERVLSELKTTTEHYFPQRPPTACVHVLAVSKLAIKVREAVARLHAAGIDIHVQVHASNVITTLWIGRSNNGGAGSSVGAVYYGDEALTTQLDGCVWYGDKPVLAQLALVLQAGSTAATGACTTDPAATTGATTTAATTTAATTTAAILPLKPRYTYTYKPNDDGARYLAEMIALAPDDVRAQFGVVADAAMVAQASFVDDEFLAWNVAALETCKDALADEVAARTKDTAEYVFAYDPTCAEDVASVANLRARPPVVSMRVTLMKEPAGTVCSLRWRRAPPYSGLVARMRLAATLDAIQKTRFGQYMPRAGYTASMVLNMTPGTPREKRMLAELEALVLSDKSIHVQYYFTDYVITTLWTDDGKHAYYGLQAVFDQVKRMVKENRDVGTTSTAAMLDVSQINVEQLTVMEETGLATAISGHDSAHDSAHLPLRYFIAARQAVMTPPAGYAPDSVRYRMTVKDSERDGFMKQLLAMPADWRSRISVVFVDDAADIKQNCVELWPQAAGFPKSTRYEDVLQMLLWKEL